MVEIPYFGSYADVFQDRERPLFIGMSTLSQLSSPWVSFLSRQCPQFSDMVNEECIWQSMWTISWWLVPLSIASGFYLSWKRTSTLSRVAPFLMVRLEKFSTWRRTSFWHLMGLQLNLANSISPSCWSSCTWRTEERSLCPTMQIWKHIIKTRLSTTSISLEILWSSFVVV